MLLSTIISSKYLVGEENKIPIKERKENFENIIDDIINNAKCKILTLKQERSC